MTDLSDADMLQHHSRNVSEAILEQLQLCGVKRIYGVIGDAIFGLMDAIAKQNDIRFIAVKHESVAALMASAEAKCTGNLGVCVAQMGPGLANLVNGLGDAYLDQYPVLAITGQAPLAKIGTPYKQLINQQELVQAITGYSELVVHPDAVLPALSEAVQTSMSMQTVSHLSIPVDVFMMSTQVQPNIPFKQPKMNAASAKIQQALQMMQSARQPMVLLGDRSSAAATEVLKLAETWGCGVALAYGAAGMIPDSAPHGLEGLGEGGNPYLTGRFKEADVVLAIDTTWWPKENTPKHAQVIHIGQRLMPISNLPANLNIAGDISPIISQLAEGLKDYDINPKWTRQIEQCKQTWAKQNEQEGNEKTFPLHPSRIVREIERCASPDAIIALDEGDHTLWFTRNFRAENQQILMTKKWRTMGFGLPAAMAAKCSFPERQILCVTGDGGLGMVMADLLTAVRYQLDITLIVFNNGALQMEHNKMVMQGLIPEGTELTNPDFAKLALTCGWDAYRVTSPEELKPLLQKAQDKPGPVLLDVPTARVPYPDYPKPY